MKTLAELKAENAAAEESVTEEVETTLPEMVEEAEEVIDEPEEAAEEDEDSGESQESEPVEAWMQSEEEGETVPVAVLAKTRSKLKGKIGEKDSEIEKLRAEIESLKGGNVQQQSNQSAIPPRPKREDFDYDDEKYDEAVDEWQMKRFQAQQAQQNQQQQVTAQQQAQLDAIKKASDAHYQKADELVNSGLVTAESYLNADNAVRSVFEAQFPGQGDTVTDAIISQLSSVGEGSEKVMYYLGKNPSALNALKSKLATDATGMQAMAYLGSLMSKVTSAPTKKVSQAPKPATRLKGEEATTTAAKPMQKKYAQAHKSGNRQLAFNIKREARQKGIDTSNW